MHCIIRYWTHASKEKNAQLYLNDRASGINRLFSYTIADMDCPVHPIPFFYIP